MSLLAKLGAVVLLGLAIAACGGDGGGERAADETAIEELMRTIFEATVDADAPALADLVADECGDVEDLIAESLGQLRALGIELEFNLTGVALENLTSDSAEVLPEGTLVINGEEQPIADEGEEYTLLTKEGGEWKVDECDFFSS